MSTQQAVYHDIWCATLFGYSKCNCIAGGSLAQGPTRICDIIPKVMKEIAPMAASLPSIDTIDPEVQREIFALTAIKNQLGDRIQKRGVTLQIANELQELDTAAKRWLEIKEKQRVEMKKPILEAARKQDTYWGDRMNPVKSLRDWCRQGIGAYNTEQQRKADAARREAQRLAQEQADRDQRAKADALLAEAAQLEASGHAETAAFVLQEAEDAAQAPAIPVAVPEVAPQKVDGSSVSYKLVGTVRDPIAYLTYLLSKPELIAEVVVWSQSGLNAQLKRGLPLGEHGVDITKQTIVSNRAR